MDITKERPQYVWLGYDKNDIIVGKWKLILYEDILNYQFHFKHEGHTIDRCMIRKREDDAKRRKKEEDVTRLVDEKDAKEKLEQKQGQQQPNSFGDKNNETVKTAPRQDQWQDKKIRSNKKWQEVKDVEVITSQQTSNKSIGIAFIEI